MARVGSPGLSSGLPLSLRGARGTVRYSDGRARIITTPCVSHPPCQAQGSRRVPAAGSKVGEGTRPDCDCACSSPPLPLSNVGVCGWMLSLLQARTCPSLPCLLRPVLYMYMSPRRRHPASTKETALLPFRARDGPPTRGLQAFPMDRTVLGLPALKPHCRPTPPPSLQ